MEIKRIRSVFSVVLDAWLYESGELIRGVIELFFLPLRYVLHTNICILALTLNVKFNCIGLFCEMRITASEIFDTLPLPS